MSILGKLSSQVGDRTEAANKRMVTRALKQPALLDEIAIGLSSADAKLAGDCAEVMTLVAAERPELVAPHAEALIARLDHKDTRVRWEAMHGVAEIAALVPDRIAPLVPRLAEIIARDKSVIVRDYAILTLGEYGRTSAAAARAAWPHLREALTAWQSKHAGKVLEAMTKLVAVDAALKAEAQDFARRFADHTGAKVRTLAKRLLKSDVIRIAFALILWNGSAFALFAGVIAPLSMTAWLRWTEEPELIERFGDGYRAYRPRVPAFFNSNPRTRLTLWRFLVTGG